VAARHPEILEEWKKSKSNPPAVNLDDDKTVPFDDIATAIFESVAAAPAFKNRWLEPEEFPTDAKDDKGEPVKGKRFKAVAEGGDLQATFFDMWLQAHADADLQKAPADLVMASGSGLDPHITMRNAMYQLDRVVDERLKNTKRVKEKVRGDVQKILEKHSFTPLSGLIGEPLVNVLAVNIELDKDFPMAPEPPKSPEPAKMPEPGKAPEPAKAP